MKYAKIFSIVECMIATEEVIFGTKQCHNTNILCKCINKNHKRRTKYTKLKFVTSLDCCAFKPSINPVEFQHLAPSEIQIILLCLCA